MPSYHVKRSINTATPLKSIHTSYRTNKLKLQKSPVGIEYYLNDPNTTAQAELTTEIALPLK